MQFDEMGSKTGKTLMLLPGTACDYQTNFGSVLDRLGEKYHLICVNYDGFDGSDSIFPDVLTVTEKIERYIIENYDGKLDGAIGSSLGSTFVGQLILRENVHLDHGIFGSPDLDQSGRFSAWLQSKLVVPLLTGFTKNEKKRAKTREKLKGFFEMDDEAADRFMGCFSKFSPESIKNEYYTDLLTHLEEDIRVEGTRVHFIYANKMGEKYLKRYKKYFRDPDIREFAMQHEQWLFGGEKYAGPVLKAIDEFMEMPVSGAKGEKGGHRRTVYNPSVQYKMVSGLFKMLGVNKMLDKEGAEFEKLLEDCRKKQEKPLKVPYKKMTGFDIDTDIIDGTTCYIVRVKGAAPKKAVLYLFGGGYILPPDPGDIILCGQIADRCDAEVWFPLYPMAPEYRLVETLQSTLKVYQKMLETYAAEDIRFFGTSSGGGQAMSLCVFVREEHPEVPLPGKLVLQSPGLQVPPSEEQKEEMERRKKYDVMIPPRFFDRIAPVLASGEEAYLLSPVLYDLTGFPAMEVFYGTREVMIAYLPDLKRACLRYGVPLRVHIGKGMMHCWGAMEFVPEAKAAREEYYGALK